VIGSLQPPVKSFIAMVDSSPQVADASAHLDAPREERLARRL